MLRATALDSPDANAVSPRRRPSNRKAARRSAGGRSASESLVSWAARFFGGTAATWTVGLLLLAVALGVDPRINDGFRTPKLWLAELLALVSLLLLSSRLLTAGPVDLRAVARQPALRAVVPLLVVACLGLLGSDYPRATAGALASFALGAAALVGWSAGLDRSRLRNLLAFLLVPAALLAVLGVLQFHGWFRPFQFAGMREANRLAVTSLAGSAGDLGAFLALAAVVGQAELLRRRGASRWIAMAALGLAVYGVLISQTLTAVAALGLSSLVFWGALLPRKRRLPALGALVAGALVLMALVAPLRQRVVTLGQQLVRGEINVVLTGRLDPWRVALRQLADHPFLGVGLGAFEPSFAEAKLELVEAGVPFLPGQRHVMFDTPHNEVLQVGAECGLLGLLALAWAVWVVIRRARRARAGQAGDRGEEPGAASEGGRRERALIWAGLTALAVLSLTFFPFRLALLGYPALVFLAWVLSPGGAEATEQT